MGPTPNAVIYKYPLSVGDEQTISMPIEGKVLTLQMQFGVPTLWVEIDPFYLNTKRDRSFRTFGTGQSFDKPGDYIGTYQLYDGGIVLHVYEANG